MTPCPAFEPLLLDRSSGTIDAVGAARLDEHLRSCSTCRAEAAALDDLRALMTLPPPSEAERAALVGLADALRLAQRKPTRRLSRSLRAGALLAAAAAAAMLLAHAYPLLAHRRPSHGAVLTSSQLPPESWREPDPDELWEASAFASDEADAAELGADDLALTATLDDEVAPEP